jgi:sulfite exporter TauE/SafE
MNTNWVAFFIGLFGSIHCVGMCGPLALAIPSVRDGGWLVVADKLMYNAGRIITYTVLGLIIGLLGKQLWLLGLQQGVSLVSGMLIIMAGFSRLFKIQTGNSRFLTIVFLPFNRLLHWGLKNKAGHLLIGMLNGLLPCGFVYLALVGAINTSSAIASAQYMFWFGLGTFPLMLLATISSGFAGPAVRRRITKAIPYVMICLGFWFILRGMNLNIAYLSPATQAAGISTCR